VLVNERSASASELVAGAWQDNGVATIVGETTFGKGSVQLQNTLINGGGLRLTVARWLTPNGTSISQVGVVPDIMVVVDEEMLEADEDPQLDAALEFLRTGVIPAQPEPNEVEAEGAAVGE
jgi:carboxyl-terminal processing protease